MVDRYVAAFDNVAFAQSLAEGVRPFIARVIKNTNDRQRLLLPARRERPSCRAGDNRDELAPPHVHLCHTLPHHGTAVVCVTAKSRHQCRSWVIFVGGNRGRGPVYVRSTSNRV